MNKTEHLSKLYGITSVSSKVQKLKKYPIKNAKKKQKGLIDNINKKPMTSLCTKTAGYLYDKLKLHKKRANAEPLPPLSQLDTLIYSIAKKSK